MIITSAGLSLNLRNKRKHKNNKNFNGINRAYGDEKISLIGLYAIPNAERVCIVAETRDTCLKSSRRDIRRNCSAAEAEDNGGTDNPYTQKNRNGGAVE